MTTEYDVDKDNISSNEEKSNRDYIPNFNQYISSDKESEEQTDSKTQEVMIAVFDTVKELQTCLNEMVQIGYDIDKISIIMSDTDELAKNDEEEYYYDSKNLYDEENAFEEAFGLLEPQGAVIIGNKGSFSVPNVGSIVVTGSLLSLAETSDIQSDLYNRNPEDPVLSNLFSSIGVPENSYRAFEERLKNNQIIVVLPLITQKDREMQAVISDNLPVYTEVNVIDPIF